MYRINPRQESGRREKKHVVSGVKAGRGVSWVQRQE